MHGVSDDRADGIISVWVRWLHVWADGIISVCIRWLHIWVDEIGVWASWLCDVCVDGIISVWVRWLHIWVDKCMGKVAT